MNVKRSFSLAGHRTSVSLEPEFWQVLEQMAAARTLSLAALIQDIDQNREGSNLASACRLEALRFFRAQSADR
ncbi:MAG: ribbon-helix-helix domain-containing protein [Pseudomonadota bacterium]